MRNDLLYKKESYEIVGVMYEVFNNLGYGHKEFVYQKAIAKEFKVRKIHYKEQLKAKIKYKGEDLGYYVLDFLVFRKIVIELKQKPFISRKDISQLYRYLKTTGLQLGMLVSMTNSGVKIKRVLNIENN